MSGALSWQRNTNHNRLLTPKTGNAPVTLDYFGGSAFRLTTAAGITVMIDPWRNHPSGRMDWFFHDFPPTRADIALSTHAHFDHDALHLVDASVGLDRLIGTYELGDLRITGIADKHAIDDQAAPYDMHRLATYFGKPNMVPPDNGRSWDNCLMLIETSGLRILHWGDNRHNPPEDVWERLGHIDVAILPIDGSQHVLSYDHIAAIQRRLLPRLTIPCHYYIWNVTKQQSTLLPPTDWLATQDVMPVKNARIVLSDLPDTHKAVDFGETVAFDVDAWHRGNGLFLGS